MNNAESFIRYALKIGAIELVPEGRKLRGGRMSPYFFNSGLFKTGESLAILTEDYFLKKIPTKTNVVFGSAYKGIPIATLIVEAMWKKLRSDIELAFNRKEIKNHGEGGIIVGHPLVGKNVCIVDDVMTTGKSSREALNIIRLNGGFSIACVIAFDRQERGTDSELSAVQEFIRNYSIPVYSIANLGDLISVLKKDITSKNPAIPNSKKVLKKILIYQDKYGIA